MTSSDAVAAADAEAGERTVFCDATGILKAETKQELAVADCGY